MQLLAALPLILFLLGLGLVAFSARYRFTGCGYRSTSDMDEETNDRWRFGFFIVWTLSLPLLWVLEWYGYYGLYHHWQNMPTPLPEFTYGRKAISDVWTGVALVLGLLAWNKKPEVTPRDAINTASGGVAKGDPADPPNSRENSRVGPEPAPESGEAVARNLR